MEKRINQYARDIDELPYEELLLTFGDNDHKIELLLDICLIIKQP